MKVGERVHFHFCVSYHNLNIKNIKGTNVGKTKQSLIPRPMDYYFYRNPLL